MPHNRCVATQGTYKVCPKCGLQATLQSTACLQCGHRYSQVSSLVPVAPPLAQTVPMADSLAAYRVPIVCQACLHCGYQDIRKVSSVFMSGAQSGALGGGFGAISHGPGGYTSTSGLFSGGLTLSSAAAQAMAPPRMPMKPSFWLLWVLGGIFTFCGLGGFGTDANGEHSLIGMGILFLMVAIGLMVWAYFAAKHAEERHRWAIGLWHAQTTVWEVLYYCPRCDNAFDPVTRRISPSHMTYTLLPHP